MGSRAVSLVLLSFASFGCAAQVTTRPPEVQNSLPEIVDGIANHALDKTGVPAASVAVVKDGAIAYLKAYGKARLVPEVAATPSMRFAIGSITKQLTASALLLLAEENKLTLDDPVSKYVPGLTRGGEVTIRELLSHTSGYQDYWPQDYVPSFFSQPATPSSIADRWAKKPLDFEPGSKWQYSNTNFVIAGMIVEKVTGERLFDFLSRRVFKPLGMSSVVNIDAKKLSDPDASGYFQYALGPLHPAPPEGPGWLFAAGDLAMTAEDLAKWDVSLIKQTLLKPASYADLERETVLKNGLGTRYGLGISIRGQDGHRLLMHGGEVSGFLAYNGVLPDDGGAVAVLTNATASTAAEEIMSEVIEALLRMQTARDSGEDALVRRVLDDFMRGTIERSLFSDDANEFFGAEAVKEYAASLAPLGPIEQLRQERTGFRGGFRNRVYFVKYHDKSADISIYETMDGKLEQFLIEVK